PLRAALAATPLFGAGRVEAPWTLLGHALRQAVGLAARALGVSAEAMREDAGWVLGGHRSLKAALALDGGQPKAREQALRVVRAAGDRWQTWLEQPLRVREAGAPRQDVMDPLAQMVTPDTDPAPAGGPGGTRLKPQVAPERRISLADADMRHGRKRSAKTFNGFQAPCGLAVDRQVTRAVVVCPANEPEHEAVEWLVETWEQPPGLRPLASALGARASPRMPPWAAQGVDIMARPWPQGGPHLTQDDGTCDCGPGQVTCPGGQTVPMVPGQDA